MSREDFNYSSILIQDIMTKALITVNRATTALQVAKMMEQGGIGAVFVQDNGNPVGIVTDRDYATKIAANDLPLSTAVENIMSTPLITINHNEPISNAAEIRACFLDFSRIAIASAALTTKDGILTTLPLTVIAFWLTS